MTSEMHDNTWFEDYVDEEEDVDIIEYDLSSTPNDFNVSTLYSFMQSGTIVIPGFQRNYVWDIARASRLIESLIRGLPVPQLFLYEESRNRFLVIDGQQRLMSVYYFIKERFPRRERRSELRKIFEEQGSIPDEVLNEDEYFTNFRLRLPSKLSGRPNPLHRLTYQALGEHRLQLDLRPIRNVVVKQNSPHSDDSSIYEIFSRLNSGGVNLRPQEIRVSLYHSDFYDLLTEMNADLRWRNLLGSTEPDLHLKDVEILLRIFAMLVDAPSYTPSMVKFLNQFSRKCQTQDAQRDAYMADLFQSFLVATNELPNNAFLNKNNNRFNIALIEAAFTAACSTAYAERRQVEGLLDKTALHNLEVDPQFVEAASRASTQTANVQSRLQRGRVFIKAL